MRALLISILLVTLAHADKPKLSEADHKKYAQLLKDGRKAQAKKDYAGAIATFEKALAVVPDDATLLGEIGWTAYLDKDLKRAEEMTRKSLANQATPNIRGAALYTLGKILEDSGNPKDAIASYSESLKSRSNSVVRAALEKLDPAAAAALDPFKPQALAGPYKSIADYCKTTSKTLDDERDAECTCASDPKGPKVAAGKPYQAIDWVVRACSVPHSEIAITHYKFGVEVGGSWYVGDVAETDENRHCTNSVESREAKLDAGRLMVTLGETGDCMGGDREATWKDHELVVVGIGPSGKPSATPTIMVTRVETEVVDMFEPNTRTKTIVDIALDLAWGKDNTLTIKGKTKGGDPSVVGKHALAFP